MEKQVQQKDFVYAKKKNIQYVMDGQGQIKKYKPWLGDMFSFLYDLVMERSVFPVKFNADAKKHLDILKQESAGMHHASILEIGTGSGNAACFLNPDNHYAGIDISTGLLRKAYSRFRESGFEKFDLFVASDSDLPFPDHQFDFACCHLSLNFFNDIELFIGELRRVLKTGATFFCSVPVPERKPAKSKIRGTLYTVAELKTIFQKNGFEFAGKSYQNGAIYYFSASKKDDH